MYIAIDPDMYDEEDPVNRKAFHNTTKEYVIFLLLFAFLYTTSYCFIGFYQKKFPSYPDCYEDPFANGISLLIGSFAFSVSVGADFILPVSTISNEVPLLYPNTQLLCSVAKQLINSRFMQPCASLFKSCSVSKYHNVNKVRYDAKFVESKFNVGDLVLYEEFQYPNTPKLAPPYSGCYTILSIKSNVNYEIDRPNYHTKQNSKIVHVCKLRIYNSPDKFKLYHEQ